ncbi:hypothetical protein HG536_0D05580 [Torulaspora globosa]|uniref:Kinesin-like protein n=1 Tax=Torulaspora globosa TaxID=48254 RepID=A0A7G3ZHQ1_9SACH|nr:uncharacterized protein HG536_0D05580 [Torulaspora globosa]QLL33037.1 hypothetical protein HG536_0D05580 [Torulaspora globosa]
METSDCKRQSSIVVAVRVRPFTAEERAFLGNEDSSTRYSLSIGDSKLVVPLNSQTENGTGTKITRPPAMTRPRGIRKVVECVDDKMMIFDPAETNPLNTMSETVLNSIYSHSRNNRRRLRRGGGELKFVFDKLYDEDATQMDVYSGTTSALLDSVLDGFNGTVFAYGATGCGKTYTVSGSPEEPGIIFLAMQDLFNRIEALKDTKKFEISLSYLEIYNEMIRDLLKPETSPKKLVIREDSENGISVANLSHHRPQTVDDVMDMVIRANMNRTTSATDANEASSRSHAVLQINIIQSNRSAEITSNHTFAKLSIIDLAGSERAASTKNRGERLHEGANINRSLLALGNCINALCMSDGTRRTCHVPYRDSKLTRLLKFSLGGNCKTVMIVCISPSSTHYDETLNTLKYANRAKEIKTKVIRNQQSLDRHVGSYLKMIEEQRQEISELRKREANVVDLQLKRYKLTLDKVQMALGDCINGVRLTYDRAEYQRAKVVKSLILCKRRFLQMISLELNNVITIAQNWTNINIVNSCSLVLDQLANKIRELEAKFDAGNDEFEQVMEHARITTLPKLREMENWDDTRDLLYFESELDRIAESLRNEILINASAMVEKLLEDPTLSKRIKFLSDCLANDSSVESAIADLAHIDQEFEHFGELFLRETDSPHSALQVPSDKPKQVKKTVRWSNLPEQIPEQDHEPEKAQEQEQAQEQEHPTDIDISMQDIATPPPPARSANSRNSLLNHRLLSGRL